MPAPMQAPTPRSVSSTGPKPRLSSPSSGFGIGLCSKHLWMTSEPKCGSECRRPNGSPAAGSNCSLRPPRDGQPKRPSSPPGGRLAMPLSSMDLLPSFGDGSRGPGAAMACVRAN